MLLPLTHIVWTDFKERNLHLFTVGIITLFTALYLVFRFGRDLYYPFYLWNLAFSIILFGVSAFLVAISRKESMKNVLGAGDVLFILPVCFWFETMNYIIWLNITLVLTLIAHVVLLRTRFYHTHKTVPLAGFFAVSFGLYLIFLIPLDL